jgi:uncharacterized membrane protein AbrB (regulator of aidB expression)
MRRAARWLGPTQPPTGLERAVLVLGAVFGLTLIIASGLDGWLTAIGVGLLGGCIGGLVANRGFRPKPREPSRS